jgi:hypothetical protein
MQPKPIAETSRLFFRVYVFARSASIFIRHFIPNNASRRPRTRISSFPRASDRFCRNRRTSASSHIISSESEIRTTATGDAVGAQKKEIRKRILHPSPYLLINGLAAVIYRAFFILALKEIPPGSCARSDPEALRSRRGAGLHRSEYSAEYRASHNPLPRLRG